MNPSISAHLESDVKTTSPRSALFVTYRGERDQVNLPVFDVMRQSAPKASSVSLSRIID
jgi:hypothetical protein